MSLVVLLTEHAYPLTSLCYLVPRHHQDNAEEVWELKNLREGEMREEGRGKGGEGGSKRKYYRALILI